MSNQLPSGFVSVSDSDLKQLVSDAIEAKIKANATFTAFGIALELRKANPTLNISHRPNWENSGVRECVHNYMGTVGTYSSVIAVQPDGQDAMEYFPKPVITVDTTATPVISPLVGQLLNTAKRLAAKVGINIDLTDDELREINMYKTIEFARIAAIKEAESHYHWHAYVLTTDNGEFQVMSQTENRYWSTDVPNGSRVIERAEKHADWDRGVYWTWIDVQSPFEEERDIIKSFLDSEAADILIELLGDDE